MIYDDGDGDDRPDLLKNGKVLIFGVSYKLVPEFFLQSH
jgi:hypothetical protein